MISNNNAGSISQNNMATQNCVPYDYYQQQHMYSTPVYITNTVVAPNDALIDKLENGFLITIKGKKWVAQGANDLALIIARELSKEST